MRVVLQRVSSASVTVDGQIVGQIGEGLLALVGIARGDTDAEVRWMADKTAELRVFEDDQGKMNRSLLEIGGSALVVSQFTLLGDCRKGRRPAFTGAADPEVANRLYTRYADLLAERGVGVQRGTFAADMQVALVNNGPVTVILERVP